MMSELVKNLKSVQKQIEATCAQCHRNPQTVRLIAVCKNQPAAALHTLIQAGHTDLGENYVQEWIQHRETLPPTLTTHPQWHFIGQLQKNKVRHLIGHVALIHSVDSWGLAQAIHQRAQIEHVTQSILLQVKLASEATKGGMTATELASLLPRLNDLTALQVQGLMLLPPLHEDPEQTRPYFRQLREIREECNEKKIYKNPLTELSMGMSHDFPVALEEGATMIRIGTAIFGTR